MTVVRNRNQVFETSFLLKKVRRIVFYNFECVGVNDSNKLHKSILNEISCAQRCILSTVALECLARRNTTANAEPHKKIMLNSLFALSVSRSTSQNNMYTFV